MALVFLGTSAFAASILRSLAEADDQRPSLVLTRPDSRAGRGRRTAPPPVAVAARELGLALAQPQSVNEPEVRTMIAGADPSQSPGDGGARRRQTVVVCAFGALIREPLLSEHDMLNVHPSLLPRWRGAAPVERAIMAGDEHSGVSIMRLTAGLDSGPVCLRAAERLRADDTYGSLAPRLAQLGAELLLRALRERPPFVEQPREGVSYAEKITAQERTLDPARTAVELERAVRALTPHIGARLRLADGSMLGVLRARVAGPPADGCERGLSADGERLLLGCAEGVLELLEVQPPGGRPMAAADYLRGHRVLGTPPGGG